MGKTRETSNLVSNNNIFSNISNSNVGIGSTIPQYKLDVSGDINCSGAVVSGIVSAVGPITISAIPFYQNVQNVSQNFTVHSNFNAMSIGPIGINTGIVVNINTGGTWVII